MDDDEELCAEMAEVLAGEGYAVKSTSDPEKGRGLIAAHAFDIALFDYKLPGTTGVELMKEVKKKDPETRVFIISGRPFIEQALEEEKVSGLVSGVIPKPFDCEVLLKKIAFR